MQLSLRNGIKYFPLVCKGSQKGFLKFSLKLACTL